MKKLAKSIVVAILWHQVARLRKNNKIKVVAVAGSIGKTSTKFAVANVLKQKYKVRFQEGNYNDIVTVPLIFFGQPQPSLLNPFAWAKVIISNSRQIKNYPYEVVVVELGTDGPGQMARFGKYLWVDLAVVTAITPEHMEYFAGIDAVAWEELSIAKYSHKLLANSDLTHQKYLRQLDQDKLQTYAINQKADYQVGNVRYRDMQHDFDITKHGDLLLHASHTSIAEPQLYSVAAASAVANILGMESADIVAAISRIHPVSGRMNQLKGINDSLIIDDTYNASPEAVKAALHTLYKLPAPQKIAVLGNMNELGKYSADAHTEIGDMCDPKEIDLLVTIGPDANKYLAAAAKRRGCQVMSFTSPFQAGQELKELVKPKAVILAKGSQNGVFAEELVKQLLANPGDAKHLVRQSKSWMKIKNSQFGVL